MRVSVFGLGYVGSVTAVSLAKAGHHVLAVDKEPSKVALAAAGTSPVLEPGLAEEFSTQVRSGRLRSTLSAREAIAESDLALLCVGTPSRSNGQPDLTALERAAAEIGDTLQDMTRSYTVAIRSTVLPGTTERLFGPIAERRHPGRPLRYMVNPEFMREGSALRDFAHPPFVVVGTQNPGDETLLRLLYAGVAAPFVQTSLRTAELLKPVCNAYHALKVCFANEVGSLAELMGADGREVMRIFCLDRKLNVSEAYLRPGFAFGGSCLPKDVRALAHMARMGDVETPVLASIMPSNQDELGRGLARIHATGKRRIGVVGLAFKPGSDDVRDSPFLAVVEQLLAKGYEVRVFDRDLALSGLVGANRKHLFERLPHVATLLCGSVQALLAHSEVVVMNHSGPEATRVLQAVEPRHIVIDLTRDFARALTHEPPHGHGAAHPHDPAHAHEEPRLHEAAHHVDRHTRPEFTLR